MDSLTPQETSHILAGLRALQGTYSRNELAAIATDEGEHEQLTDEEVDDLCERLNCADEVSARTFWAGPPIEAFDSVEV